MTQVEVRQVDTAPFSPVPWRFLRPSPDWVLFHHDRARTPVPTPYLSGRYGDGVEQQVETLVGQVVEDGQDEDGRVEPVVEDVVHQVDEAPP